MAWFRWLVVGMISVVATTTLAHAQPASDDNALEPLPDDDSPAEKSEDAPAAPPAATPAPPAPAPPTLAPSAAPAPAEPGPAPTPPFRAAKRIMIGLGGGWGIGGHAGPSVCDCDPERRSTAFDLHVAFLHGPRLAFVAALSGDVRFLDPRGPTPPLPGFDHKTLQQTALVLGARAWLTRRLWLEGTAGVARAIVPPQFCESGVDAPPDGCDPEFERWGFALAGAAGFEVVSTRSFALSARGRVGTGYHGDLGLITATLGFGLDVFF